MNSSILGAEKDDSRDSLETVKNDISGTKYEISAQLDTFSANRANPFNHHPREISTCTTQLVSVRGIST